MQTKHLCALIHIRTKGEVAVPVNMFKPFSVFFCWLFQGSASFVDHFCYLCFILIFVMLSCLFLAALWSPAGKELTPWLSSVLCFLVFLSPSKLVFRVRYGTWLYRFLIFAFLSTLKTCTSLKKTTTKNKKQQQTNLEANRLALYLI